MASFSCCTRADESKYLHLCGCPSATFTCVSEQITPTLCGYDEAPGYESTPPLRYRVLTSVGSGSWELLFSNGDSECYKCDGLKSWQYLWGGSGTTTHSKVDCSESTVGAPYSEANRWKCSYIGGAPCSEPEAYSYTPYAFNGTQTPMSFDWAGTPSSALVRVEMTLDAPEDSRTLTHTISVLDEDQDAIDRETPAAGTSCSSISETRETTFGWTVRTSKYTISCSNLMAGITYEVAPAIRRSLAVAGDSSRTWTDVSVAPQSITPTSDTYDFAAVDLGHVAGYEYQITGVTIEKKA